MMSHTEVQSQLKISSSLGVSEDTLNTIKMGSKNWKPFYSKLIVGGQFFADALTVLIVYFASHWIYTKLLYMKSPQTLEEFAWMTGLITLVYLVVLDRLGLYKREVSLMNIKELRGIFHVGIYAAGFILAASFYIRSFSLSRITFTIAMVVTPVALYLQRTIFYKLHVYLHQRGFAQKKVLIYGAGQIGTQLAQRLFDSPSLGYLPVGFLDDLAEKHGQVYRWIDKGPKSGIKVLGGEELLPICKQFGIDSVMIALPSASFEKNQHLVELCVENEIDYSIVPNAYEKFIQNIQWFELGSIPLLRRKTASVNIYYLFVKRLLDILSAATLMILLGPFYLTMLMWIRWDSKGPVIFKQKRVGLRGREFSFYKFRTMHVDAPKYARSPEDPSDSRITRVGKWLRRTSLDELPQLYNVLRGDMSLVGPRPEMPFIVNNYTPLERRRLEAKPGITGVWQISAVRGEPIHANIEYDLFYIENRSLLLDFAVMVKTVLSVIKGIGAV